jgi:poly(A) polymerase
MRVSGAWIDHADTQRVCKTLTDAGFQALFVGGCVRNALFGIAVTDIDLTTDATPEQVSELAGKSNLTVIPTGLIHGTVTVVSGDIVHEVTTFRRDVDTDGRRAVVEFSSSILEDAQRRDFTMNALYATPSGDVIDPLKGLDDLQQRKVRFINDPVERIREDYLRILRFFRFHALYGDESQGINRDGLAAIADNLNGLDHLSKERVGSEIKKLMMAKNPAPATAAMRAVGVLQRVLPAADDRFLSRLVHLEETIALPADAMRRLAILGGDNVSEKLRLSKAEAKKLGLLRDQIGSGQPAHELGYRFGKALALDVLVLRSAIFETDIDRAELADVETGSLSEFPVKALDLASNFQGPALGEKLRQLEKRWIDSKFSLARDELLND